jgi:hypothetical protein
MVDSTGLLRVIAGRSISDIAISRLARHKAETLQPYVVTAEMFDQAPNTPLQ